jgi:hypothetical protein
MKVNPSRYVEVFMTAVVIVVNWNSSAVSLTHYYGWSSSHFQRAQFFSLNHLRFKGETFTRESKLSQTSTEGFIIEGALSSVVDTQIN